jgi:DNA-binding transcriptional LysR family regulator
MSSFDWNDLKFFLEAARAGSLSGAARALGTDHATVGRRIDALERALERSLLHRSIGGCVLTTAGEDMLVQAEQMEALALGTARDSSAPGSTTSGVVRITTPDGFGNFFLSKRLADFARAYPRVTVQLASIQQIQAQSQREGDVVITLTPGRVRHRSEKLVSYGLGLYCSRDYLDQHPVVTSREDLRTHSFVGYIEELLISKELDYLDDVLRGLRAHLQCSSLLGQVTATQAGAGMSVLPHYLARQFPDLAPVLPDSVGLRRTYWLNSAAEANPPPRARAVIDFLRKAVQAYDFC